MRRGTRRAAITAFLKNEIKEANERNTSLEKNELISITCLEFNCGERLVKEILKHLRKARELREHKGQIWHPEAYRIHMNSKKAFENLDEENDEKLEDL